MAKNNQLKMNGFFVKMFIQYQSIDFFFINDKNLLLQYFLIGPLKLKPTHIREQYFLSLYFIYTMHIQRSIYFNCWGKLKLFLIEQVFR